MDCLATENSFRPTFFTERSSCSGSLFKFRHTRRMRCEFRGMATLGPLRPALVTDLHTRYRDRFLNVSKGIIKASARKRNHIFLVETSEGRKETIKQYKWDVSFAPWLTLLWLSCKFVQDSCSRQISPD